MPDGRVGQDVGDLVADLGRQVRHARVLGAQDVLAEQPLERRDVADRAALELGDEDGGATAGVGDAAHRRHGGGQLAGAAGAHGEHTALLVVPAPPGVHAGDGGESVGVRGQPGQQHVGHQPPRGEPDEVESQGGGTDQRVRHSALPPGKRSGRGLRPVRPC